LNEKRVDTMNEIDTLKASLFYVVYVLHTDCLNRKRYLCSPEMEK